MANSEDLRTLPLLLSQPIPADLLRGSRASILCPGPIRKHRLGLCIHPTVLRAKRLRIGRVLFPSWVPTPLDLFCLQTAWPFLLL
jgi:hypothetical protein